MVFFVDIKLEVKKRKEFGREMVLLVLLRKLWKWVDDNVFVSNIIFDLIYILILF